MTGKPEDTEQDTSNHYSNLLEDNKFLSSAYHALDALGEKPNWDNPKEIVDKFLTKKRYFDTNLLFTINTALDVSKLDAAYKKDFAYALDRAEKMPSFYETGGAPTASALKDYALAAVADPTNLASAVAAAFTAGAGGAAALSARQAATTGIRSALKADLVSTFTGAGLKTLATEGAISGTGNALQEAIKESTEKDVGLREELSPGSIAGAGIIGGVAAPIVGAGLGIFGKAGARGVGDLTGAAVKALPEGVQDSIEKATNWISRNIKPAGGLDADATRNLERTMGEASILKERGQDLTDRLAKSITSDFDVEAIVPGLSPLPNGNPVKYKDILNKALEGDTSALNLVQGDSPDTFKHIQDFFSLRDQAHQFGIVSKLPIEVKNLLEASFQAKDYVRDVPEAYARNKRVLSFEDFLDKNPNVSGDMKALILSDPDKFKDSVKIFGDHNNIVTPYASGSAEEAAYVDKQVKEYIKEKYTATRLYNQESGVLKSQEPIPEVMKEILGYNNDPAIRVAETISGIVDGASRVTMASDLGNHAVMNGLGVELRGLSNRATLSQKLAEASAKMGGEKMVPLVKASVKEGLSEDDKALIPFIMSDRLIPDNLKNVFVTEDYARVLKTALNDNGQLFGSLYGRQDIVGTAFRSAMGLQAFIKAGKTVASPLSHMRNMASSFGYTAASGNLMSVVPILKRLASDPKSFSSEWNMFKKLGMADSSIDVNQVLKRFEDVTGGDDKSFLAKFISGTTGGKLARKAYANTDNAFKFAVWQNEKVRAEKIFNAMSPVDQQAARDAFEKNIFKPTSTLPISANVPTYTDADVIAEMAARKTADITPVYGRVSPILEKLRSVPIVGTFTSYPAERIRNSFNVLKIGTDELKQGYATGNKELIKAGSTRLSQWYATQASLYTTAYALNQSVNGEDGNPLADFARKHLPEWSKNSPIVITKKNEDGSFHYIDLGSINPDQYMADAIFPMLAKASRGEDVSEDLDKAVGKSLHNLLKPFIDPSLVREALQDARATFMDGDMKAAARLSKMLEPGYAKMARDYATDSGALRELGPLGYKAETFMKPNRFGEVRDDGASWMNQIGIMGAKEQKMDPKTTAGFVLNQVNREYKGSWNNFKTDVKSTLGDPNSKFSNEDFVTKYKENMDKNFERQRAIYKLTQDLQEDLGMSTHEIKKMLLSPALSGVSTSKKELDGVIKGHFTPIEFSKEDSEWKNIILDLKQRTGDATPFREEVRSVRTDLREVEKLYHKANLNRRKAVEED